MTELLQAPYKSFIAALRKQVSNALRMITFSYERRWLESTTYSFVCNQGGLGTTQPLKVRKRPREEAGFDD